MIGEIAVPDKRFIFHGAALAFGGRIRRPDDLFLKAAAASNLPVTGGLVESHLASQEETKPFHYKDVITFSSAYSRAHGDYLDPKQALEFTNSNHGTNNLPTSTSVEARLENLKIDVIDPAARSLRRTFTAGLLHVQMTSTSNRREPIAFSSLGVKFEGIQLTTGDGMDIATLQVETATDIFSIHDTKAKLLKAYSDDSDFRKAHSHMLLPLGEQDKGGLGGMFVAHKIPYADKGLFAATVVKSLKWAGAPPPGTEIVGNRLTIEGFGRIFFGEILIDENLRRVTLLRFELGSPFGGDASACDVGSNGGGYPPSL
jgi:hypothetical protein